MPEFHGCFSGRAKRVCKRSLRGFGDLSIMATVWKQYTWALSLLIRSLIPEGMAYGHARVETSCLLLHVLVGAHNGGAASGVSSPQAAKVGFPRCQGSKCGMV